MRSVGTLTLFLVAMQHSCIIGMDIEQPDHIFSEPEALDDGEIPELKASLIHDERADLKLIKTVTAYLKKASNLFSCKAPVRYLNDWDDAVPYILDGLPNIDDMHATRLISHLFREQVEKRIAFILK